jgi:hypothetical protein
MNIPPEWKKVFERAGVTEEQLQDKNTAKFIFDFMSNYQGTSQPPSSLPSTPIPSKPISAGPPPIPAASNRRAPPPPPPTRPGGQASGMFYTLISPSLNRNLIIPIHSMLSLSIYIYIYIYIYMVIIIM